MANPKEGFGTGVITRQFTVWCGVCSDHEIQSANTIDQFIEQITNEKGAKWRLTREHGWCHKTCSKLMPTSLKFK